MIKYYNSQELAKNILFNIISQKIYTVTIIKLEANNLDELITKISTSIDNNRERVLLFNNAWEEFKLEFKDAIDYRNDRNNCNNFNEKYNNNILQKCQIQLTYYSKIEKKWETDKFYIILDIFNMIQYDEFDTCILYNMILNYYKQTDFNPSYIII